MSWAVLERDDDAAIVVYDCDVLGSEGFDEKLLGYGKRGREGFDRGFNLGLPAKFGSCERLAWSCSDVARDLMRCLSCGE